MNAFVGVEQDLGLHPQGVTPASALAAASKAHGGKEKGKKPSFLLKKVVGDLNVAEILFGTLGIGAAVGGYFYYKKHHHHGRR
jgi:hypothetical protein